MVIAKVASNNDSRIMRVITLTLTANIVSFNTSSAHVDFKLTHMIRSSGLLRLALFTGLPLSPASFGRFLVASGFHSSGPKATFLLAGWLLSTSSTTETESLSSSSTSITSGLLRSSWSSGDSPPSMGSHSFILCFLNPFLPSKWSSIWLNLSVQASTPLFFNSFNSLQKPHQNLDEQFRPILQVSNFSFTILRSETRCSLTRCSLKDSLR